MILGEIVSENSFHFVKQQSFPSQLEINHVIQQPGETAKSACRYLGNYSNVTFLSISKKKFGRTNKRIRAMKMAKWQ